jgi:hypothetical protein
VVFIVSETTLLKFWWCCSTIKWEIKATNWLMFYGFGIVYSFSNAIKYVNDAENRNIRRVFPMKLKVTLSISEEQQNFLLFVTWKYYALSCEPCTFLLKSTIVSTFDFYNDKLRRKLALWRKEAPKYMQYIK